MRIQIILEELERMTKRELYQIAKEIDLKGRGRMRKRELLEALKRELLLVEKASVEEPITSNILPPEPLPEKTEEETPLPTYREEFVTLIPVNPELSLVVWNTEGNEGILRVYVEGAPALEFPVNLSWRRFYVHLRAPFKEIKAELVVDGKVLRSNPIVAPSDQVFLEIPERAPLLSRLALPVPSKEEERVGYGGENG